MKPKCITRTYQMFSNKHGQLASIQRHLRQLQREQRQLFFLILSISFRCGSVLCLLFSFIRWAFRCKLYCCCYFCYRFEVHTQHLWTRSRFFVNQQSSAFAFMLVFGYTMGFRRFMLNATERDMLATWQFMLIFAFYILLVLDYCHCLPSVF